MVKNYKNNGILGIFLIIKELFERIIVTKLSAIDQVARQDLS